MGEPWPTKLRFLSDRKLLAIAFDDGFSADIPYELLRVESPSAEVQGHGGAQKQIVSGKREVDVSGAEPVGRYAVRIKFDDGHNSGLYTWRYLREVAENSDEMMAKYQAAVAEKGLSREQA